MRSLPKALLALSALSALSLMTAGTALAGPPRLALIIDDIGYSVERGARVIALPGPVTLAVLPFTPNAAEIARLAQRSGKDVILHQPMQSMAHPGHDARGTLTLAMDRASVRASLNSALNDVPYAIGISNHTGSLLTSRPQPMSWLMEEIRAHGLFFLDSRTTHETVARRVALEAGVPSAKRDVFLDHVVQPEAIAAQFDRALGIARRRGYAIVIGHPHELTLAFLERELPGLSDRGIVSVSVHSLVRPPQQPDQTTLALLETPASPRTVPDR